MWIEKTMPSNDLHSRRHSVRLKGYDYSQPGAYFITLVAHARACIFGEIQGESIALSRVGEIVKIVWQILPNYFPIRLDEWGIMPNNFHGIIVIEDPKFKINAGPGKGESGGHNIHLPQSPSFPPASPRPDSGSREPPDESAGLGKGEAGGNNPGLLKLTSFPPASPIRPNQVAREKGERPAGTASGSLGAILQTFKSMTTRKINALQRTPGGIVWQRNYYEHVIRNEKEWENIRLYIQVNPLRWDEDDENPSTLMR
jgi:putative transposase